MNNYKLIIQYLGKKYAGWQIQQNAVSVQGTVTESINKILRDDINLIGSGRTDTGVNAWGQVANFRSDKIKDTDKFRYSLNSVLPDDISVRSVDMVHYDFHSRFDAVSRSYFYLIRNDKLPFYKDYTGYFPYIHDFRINELNKLAAVFLGEQDFTSFSKKNSEVNHHICTVKNIRFTKRNEIVYFYVEANRFLHGMVRALLGTILKIYQTTNQPESLIEILEKKDRNLAGMAVPAQGLFLFKVNYQS